MPLKKWLERLIDLIYPRKAVCMACGSETGCDRNDICEDCRTKLAENRIGPKPAENGSGIDSTAFAYAYAGPAGSIVRNLKYGSVRILADEMAYDIAREVRLLRLDESYIVTCVPMHPKRQRQRGFNHAELLARKTAGELGLEYRNLLCRTRNVKQQAKLTKTERRKNMEGVFMVSDENSEAVKDTSVLLIDDVMTTGTTAHECAKALRKAGALRVSFAAYANGKGKKK